MISNKIDEKIFRKQSMYNSNVSFSCFHFYHSVSGRCLPFLECCFQCMLISDVYNSDYLLWHLFKVVLFI